MRFVLSPVEVDAKTILSSVGLAGGRCKERARAHGLSSWFVQMSKRSSSDAARESLFENTDIGFRESLSLRIPGEFAESRLASGFDECDRAMEVLIYMGGSLYSELCELLKICGT